ncbi:MAG: HD domain-containing protein [Spirochaetales bacterium]|nr:HD domain-containing protein [Spirochaetales bacterium]
MEKTQLSMLFEYHEPDDILAEVKRLYRIHYPFTGFSRVKKTFTCIKNLFAGKFRGYRACNTEYHNLSHTIDTMLAAMRLIDGYNIENEPFSREQCILLLQAALLHDTGYIQKTDDFLGTGAKYTREHVERSKEFLKENHTKLSLAKTDISFLVQAIDSTGVNPSPVVPREASKQDQYAAVIVGAADLIAQMADRVYLEKLLFLYYEFREAGIPGYDTEFDIIRKTLEFYEIAVHRLEKEFLGVYHCARSHFRLRYASDYNIYMQAIENNIEYIRKIIEDDTTNFRAKLHRVSI